MIPTIVVIILILVIGLVILVSRQPSEFQISREIIIAAPPESVFPEINNVHRFQAWNPWSKLDPDAEIGFEGPDEGTGATYRWSGNRNVGQGSSTVIESKPFELVRFRLDFVKPFKGTSTAEFVFEAKDHSTVVRWTLFGQNQFAGKLISLLMDCEKMMGAQFEKGLADLKQVVEGKKPRKG